MVCFVYLFLTAKKVTVQEIYSSKGFNVYFLVFFSNIFLRTFKWSQNPGAKSKSRLVRDWHELSRPIKERNEVDSAQS